MEADNFPGLSFQKKYNFYLPFFYDTPFGRNALLCKFLDIPVPILRSRKTLIIFSGLSVQEELFFVFTIFYDSPFWRKAPLNDFWTTLCQI
jgi:hypothetical protein